MTPSVPRDDVRRALVVTAHPDDVDFGAAGTVASWTASGIEVAYCLCTSGEASGDGTASRAEVARTRESEQRAAAAEVGVTELTFLGYPDGRLTPSLELRRDISRVIRAFGPDRILTWSPEINWDFVVGSHPDHRAAGQATFAAVYPDARNPRAHPELLTEERLQPWTVGELWMVDSPNPLANHVVDVTDTFQAKMAALRSHRSQTAHLTGLHEQIRERLAMTAQRHGLATGRLAETFQVVNTA